MSNGEKKNGETEEKKITLGQQREAIFQDLGGKFNRHSLAPIDLHAWVGLAGETERERKKIADLMNK